MGRTLYSVASVALFAFASAACGSTSEPHSGASSAGDEHTGSLNLSLVPVTGVQIDQIAYVVDGPGSLAPIAEGDFPTAGTADSLSIALPLPPGDGYQLSLSGQSTVAGDHVACGGSFGPFGVHSGGATALNVAMECHQTKDGPIDPSTQIIVDACPRLRATGLIAQPAVASAAGGTIAVSGTAYDLDGKVVTYAWSLGDPSVATFSQSSGASTVATCAKPGSGVQLLLTVGNGECTKVLTSVISCVAP